MSIKKPIKLFITTSLAGLAILVCMWPNPTPTSAVTCNPNATKQCISNIVYWYDSCGVVQSVYQNCNTTNQICQDAQCVNKIITAPAQTPTTVTGHDVKSCYNGSLYWYSSNGTVSDIYKNCADINQCTLDNCAGNQCTNQLKCDGSTCAVNSPDYAKYCTGTTNQPVTATPQTVGQGVSIAIFASTQSNTLQLEKSINAGSTDTIYFLEVIKNTSDLLIDNISITTDLTSNIVSTGNVTIDNLPSDSNAASGVNLGTLGAKTSKVISFTGKVAPQANQGVVQITTSINSPEATYDSDYVIVTIGNQNTQNTPSTAASKVNNSNNSFLNNLKGNWYIWLAVIIILVTVFIIIFRKLSSNV